MQVETVHYILYSYKHKSCAECCLLLHHSWSPLTVRRLTHVWLRRGQRKYTGLTRSDPADGEPRLAGSTVMLIKPKRAQWRRMELRHLRCFMALAEELHFCRAAARLHIEQSPLSRTIKELEEHVGARLFERNRRGTHLTPAGEAFQREARRVFLALENAIEEAKAAAAGQANSYHLAICDGLTQPRLAAFLANLREEQPEISVRISEVTLAEQLRGLRDGTFDIGFSRMSSAVDDIVSVPLWQERLVLAIPRRHPLLAYARVPLEELLRYPLVGCHPEVCEGYFHSIENLLRGSSVQPTFVEQATSLSMLMTLVAAGYGVGFVTTPQSDACKCSDVVTRPISMQSPMLTTFLLRKMRKDTPESLTGFVDRALRELGDDLSDC